MIRVVVMILMWGWGQRWSHVDHAARVKPPIDRVEHPRGQSPLGAASARSARLIDCRTCHQLGANYQPLAVGHEDHKPCIDCHSGADFARGPRCLTCHSSIRAMKPGKTWPFAQPGEFHVAFSHAKHVAVTAKQGTCGGCHGPNGGKAERGHVACARCHANGTLPDINFCAGCHKPGPSAPMEATAASAFRVAFSHARHQQLSHAPCGACHTATGDNPARPPMKQCETCHDGKQAFAARGTHCGRCHRTDQKLTPVSTELPPFSHALHRQKGVAVENCTTCHGVGASWRATMPGQNEHRPCQNEACHAADFDGNIGSRLCLSCHERNDPFEPNPLKRPTSRVKPEWTVTMSHGPHAGLPCAGCHPSILDPIVAIPDGHALCGHCHLKTKPAMDACAACHLPVSKKQIAPWSVAARFSHDQNHRGDCRSCHAIAKDLIPPTMEGCGSCHDGKGAFKVTGFGCPRCHGARK